MAFSLLPSWGKGCNPRVEKPALPCHKTPWRRAPVHRAGTDKKVPIVTREEDVLAALDKPRALYSLQMLLDPSNKSTDALQELLMRMRTAGTVKFDIKSGRWRKA